MPTFTCKQCKKDRSILGRFPGDICDFCFIPAADLKPLSEIAPPDFTKTVNL